MSHSPIMVPPPPDGLLEKRRKPNMAFYDWGKWPHSEADWDDTQARWSDGAAIADLNALLPAGKDITITIDASRASVSFEDIVTVCIGNAGYDLDSKADMCGQGPTVTVAATECLSLLKDWKEELADAEATLEALQN